MFTYIIYFKELYRVLVRGSRGWSRNYIRRKMFKMFGVKEGFPGGARVYLGLGLERYFLVLEHIHYAQY